MFRGSVKNTGYPLHSPVFLSLSLPCVTVCHHISIGLYYTTVQRPTISVTNVADCWNVTPYSFHRIFVDVSNRLPAICIERWPAYSSPKCRYICNRLHDVTFQKTDIFTPSAALNNSLLLIHVRPNMEISEKNVTVRVSMYGFRGMALHIML